MLLRRGSSGAAVTTMTGQLAQLGYLPEATALFDRTTELALRAFQAQHLDPRGLPLVIDGIFGPLSRAALSAAVGRSAPHSPARPELPDVAELGLAQSALAIALAEYRRGAGEVGGNNRGPDIRTYLDGRAPEGSDWCAGFVSHCYREAARRAGREMPFAYSVGARAIRNELRNKGWEYRAGEAAPPQPGDIVTWWRGSFSGWQGHIGLVHSFADGIVTTIEGNRGGYPSKVGRFQYVLGRIDRLLGFARVPG